MLALSQGACCVALASVSPIGGIPGQLMRERPGAGRDGRVPPPEICPALGPVLGP